MSDSLPELFYNHTNNGDPVFYEADSELARIERALRLAFSEKAEELLAERQRLLEEVVHKSGESRS
jgi:hypothetical protein